MWVQGGIFYDHRACCTASHAVVDDLANTRNTACLHDARAEVDGERTLQRLQLPLQLS